MHPLSTLEQIESVLEQIRPALRIHNGGVELVGFEEQTGVVSVRFNGMCVGCPLSGMTLKMGIEAALQDAMPFIKEVIAV